MSRFVTLSPTACGGLNGSGVAGWIAFFFPGLKFHTVDVHGGVIRPTTSAGDVGLFAGASSANLETGALGPFRSPKGDETNEPKHILID